MIGIIGILVIFVMVFGGYLAAGGKLGIILHALPFEMMMIGGAAIGAFLISNDAAAVKHTLRDIGKVFKGPKWKPDDYRDLLCLLFTLIRLGRQNPVAIEEHIEDPGQSAIFAKYPRILADKEAVLEKRMEASQHHALHSSHALQTMADGLPALGIVAAVLGVIKTMASIDQPPEILGKMIGGALVGTFLGVFLSYGFVGPFAGKVKTVVEEDAHFYQLIREVLVANLHNHATNICIEVGRQNTPSQNRPSFTELEEAIKTVKQDAA